MMNYNLVLKSLMGNVLLIAMVMITSSITTPLFAAEGTVETISYYSNTQGTTCNMNIYLPPGYNDEADSVNAYPVLYLIHGGGENYTHWINYGGVKGTLDIYITDSIAVPMIIVMPDGKNLDPGVFRNELIDDIIPYIESNYRVIADKDHRGVGGLSWGGLQAMEAGIYDYEMFSYLTILSSGWFTNETATYNRARQFLEEHANDMEASIRYFYFAEGTETDIAYENGIATMNLFREYGLTVHYWEHSGGHSWSAWREDFKAFTPFLFRDSSTVYISLDFMGGLIRNASVMATKDSLAPRFHTPVRTGFTFTEWFREPDYLNPFDFENDTLRKNITLYAAWERNKYRISFDANGGTPVTDTLIAEYNALIEAPEDPLNPGYFLEGWYTSDSFNDKWDFSTRRVKQDLDLIALWADSASLALPGQVIREPGIYPNPAQNILHISQLEPGTQIHIFDARGRLVLQHKAEGGLEVVDIQGWTKGLYILKTEYNGIVRSRKFLIIAG